MDTAALVTTEHVPIQGSAKSIFLDMERFANALRVGELLASATLVPELFRGNVANCVIALNLADRLQVDPFMMMQTMYVVNGRAGIEGKMAIAIVEGSCRYSTLKFKFEGEGITEENVPRPDSCTAYATELKTGEVIEGPPVTWEMAVIEGWTKAKKDQVSKWDTMPYLMFRYRAAMFFARVNCPGTLLGLRTIEEIEDIEMVPAFNGTYEANEAPVDTVAPDERKTILEQFEASIPQDVDLNLLDLFIAGICTAEKATPEDVKIAAMKRPTEFWKAFEKYTAKQLKDQKLQPEPKQPDLTRFEDPADS